MFVDLDWPLNASSLLSASAELLVTYSDHIRHGNTCVRGACFNSSGTIHVSREWGSSMPHGMTRTNQILHGDLARWLEKNPKAWSPWHPVSPNSYQPKSGHSAFTPRKSYHYQLRPRQHDRQLIPKTNKLYSCNFVIRMLYKHSNWLFILIYWLLSFFTIFYCTSCVLTAWY